MWFVFGVVSADFVWMRCCMLFMCALVCCLCLFGCLVCVCRLCLCMFWFVVHVIVGLVFVRVLRFGVCVRWFCSYMFRAAVSMLVGRVFVCVSCIGFAFVVSVCACCCLFLCVWLFVVCVRFAFWFKFCWLCLCVFPFVVSMFVDFLIGAAFLFVLYVLGLFTRVLVRCFCVGCLVVCARVIICCCVCRC